MARTTAILLFFSASTLLLSLASAFTMQPSRTVESLTASMPRIREGQSANHYRRIAPPTALSMGSDAQDEVARLREQAAKAREEAAALAKELEKEAEKPVTEKKSDAAPVVDQVDVQSKISADGTFYDDEIDSAPIKTGISDSMKAKLMAEASTGLDSEEKQTNVILYISVVVAVLVALGGSGILY